MKLGIVRNPFSGRGAAARAWPKLEGKLKDTFDLTLVDTTGPDSAQEQASVLADDGYEIIAAMGGDGTLSQVMQGVLGTPAALAILPTGTGNDFARTIGIGTNLDLAVQALLGAKTKRIDVARWNVDDREGRFLNIAGCGFDASVADRINTGIRGLRGRPAYLSAMVQCLLTYRPTPLEIEADGEQISSNAMLCAIANARSYGGGMLIAPTAEVDDGWLDLVLVNDLPKLQFLRSFPMVLKGTHLSHPKVLYRRVKQVKFNLQSPFLVDGELVGCGAVQIEVVPAAIDFVVPWPSDASTL